MSLFRATDPDNQHDVLAANLLFATLLLALGENLLRWRLVLLQRDYQPQTWLALAWSLSFLLVRARWYYAVRQGRLWAKLLVAFLYVGIACFNTNWQGNYVAGISLHDWGFYSWLSLVYNLLTLAALGLMFTKPWGSRRVAA